MGAIGDDMLADLLISLMASYGVQTRLLARKPGLRTSATILPIRPNGDRPALHMPGATSSLALGPEAVLVSRAADGAALVTAAQRVDLPAFPVPVVDTTGCGDAVTAGFITGLLHGWPIEEASWLGMAAAALVAGGLGSDAGIVDYAGTIDVLRSHAPRQVLDRIGQASPSRRSNPAH